MIWLCPIGPKSRPNTTLDGAVAAAERLREAIARLEILHENLRVLVTTSIGVAEFDFADDVESLIDRADRGMYCAKVKGRNCAVAAEADRPSRSHSEPAVA